MCSSILGNIAKNCTDSFFKGHYIWHQKHCFGRVFDACFTAKLIIISYIASGIRRHKDHTGFSLSGDIMQIINSPICTWTYLYKLCLQDRLQQIPSWEYGLVTSNLSAGPWSSHFAPWSETHPKASSPSGHSTKLIHLLRLLLKEGERTYISVYSTMSVWLYLS